MENHATRTFHLHTAQAHFQNAIGSNAKLVRMTLENIVRHPMRAYYWPISSGLLLGSSTFMPWMTVGDQHYGGIPDVTALWIFGLAVLVVTLGGLSIVTRKNSRHPLLLVGLFAFGILFLAEQLMERTAAQQSWAASQARAIVAGGRAAPTAEPAMASGTYLGLAASTMITLFGLTVMVSRAPQIYAEAEDDDL